MKSGKGKISPRVAMSEPHVRRGRAADLDESVTMLKGVQSRTVQKRKSMSGRDLLKWRRQQLKQQAEETISKRLFVESGDIASIEDTTGSPILTDRMSIQGKRDRSPGRTPYHSGTAPGSVQQGKKKKSGDTPKAATSTPKMKIAATPENTRGKLHHKKSDQSNDTPQIVRGAETEQRASKRRSKKNKNTPRPAEKGAIATTQVSASPAEANSSELDNTLDSTLPMDDSVVNDGLKDASPSDDSTVTFPKTPTSAIKPRKKRTMGSLDTPAVTEKTPMPTGDDKWLDDETPSVGQNKGDFKKSLSRVKREKKKKQFLVKVSNIPKGVTPELFAMFLGECEVYPEIRIKRMKRGGGAKKKPPRYAILVCKTKEDYDTLLNLDGIAIPQLTPKGKEMTLKFMPQLTHSEARSSHALRITNLADSVTTAELREFFKKNKVLCGKVELYPADRAAYVVFKSAGDMRRARRMKARKLNGSTMEFRTNKGYINHNVEHSLMED